MMRAMHLDNRVQLLLSQGVSMTAPSQVFVGDDVRLERVRPGAILYPGARIEGTSTWISPGAAVGTEGSALARNCVLGKGAKLASGSFEDCVLLEGASLGPSGHGRAGTLLEEGASTAHAVGTKQTVLLAYATLGSNINCCDALLAGGSGPADHSEIGSGFIHFNFTPFGPTGDKATPSLFGDVPRGVLMRSPRIFLGGAGGVVGPVSIGFGTVLAAGSVWRRGRGDGILALAERLPERDLGFAPDRQGRVGEKLLANLSCIGNLHALKAYYSAVRVPLAHGDVDREAVLDAALKLLDASVLERLKQLERWMAGLQSSSEGARLVAEWPQMKQALLHPVLPPPPASLRVTGPGEAIPFARALTAEAAAEATIWLQGIVDAARTHGAAFRDTPAPEGA